MSVSTIPVWGTPPELTNPSSSARRFNDIIEVSDRQRGLDTIMWTSKFWKATAERAIKTFAQAAVAALGAGYTGILEVDFASVVSVAALATVLSVLTSVASAGAGEPGTPSLVAGGE